MLDEDNCVKFFLMYEGVISCVFCQTGPPQYRSRTVFEDATPQMVRDFFWDDEFRKKWDDMLISAQTLEDCSATGTMAVRWVRKVSEVCFFHARLVSKF